MKDTLFAACVLAFFAFAGAGVAIAIARRSRRVLSFRVLVVVSYVATNLVSGIAHLIQVSGSARGYFDAVAQLEPGQLEEVVLIEALGLIALSVGALWGLPKCTSPPTQRVSLLSPRDRSMLPVVLAVLLPVSLWASLRIQEHVATLNIERVISVSGGMARFGFMAHWLVWAISLLVIWLAFSRSHQSGAWPVFVLGAGVVAIAASLHWTGGRSIILVMALPLILVMLPQLRLTKSLAIPAGLAVAFLYFAQIVQITDGRTAGYRSGSSGLVEWLDWEWGRFSMLGFAVRYVHDNGLLFGETIAADAVTFIDGLVRKIGMSGFEVEQRSSINIAAEALLNSGSEIYIVPGMSAELYLNFGIPGILLGYFVLSRLCAWADTRFLGSSTLVTQLAWAYVGTLLVFRTIPANSGSSYGYLIFTGAPLLVVAGASYLGHRRSGQTPTARGKPVLESSPEPGGGEGPGPRSGRPTPHESASARRSSTAL